jgi:hypothetical protein
MAICAGSAGKGWIISAAIVMGARGSPIAQNGLSLLATHDWSSIRMTLSGPS